MNICLVQLTKSTNCLNILTFHPLYTIKQPPFDDSDNVNASTFLPIQHGNIIIYLRSHPEYMSSHLEYMQMHSLLAQALNQREIVNWVAVPTLKIKERFFFFCHVHFSSIYNSWKPIKSLKYDQVPSFSTFCIVIILDKPASLTSHHVLFI